MPILTFISNILSLASILFLIALVVFAVIFILDIRKSKTIDNTDEIRERIEEQEEFFHCLGVIMYWAETAAEESEIDPPAREEIIEAIDLIDDLIIEDRISLV